MTRSGIVATAEADIAVGRIEVGGRLGRLLTSTPFLGAMVALLTWPIVSIVPSAGTDASWMAGLQMAYAEGFQFGEDLIFTYGPFGFLQAPVLYDETLWVFSFLYRGFIQLAVATSLLWVARRAFPLVVALIVTYALLVGGYLEGGAVLLGFIWCFVALGDDPPRFATPLVLLGGGLLAAVELLGKANYGVAILAFCIVTVLGLPGRRRNAAVFAAMAAATFMVLWLIAEQSPSHLPDFASRSFQLMSGYSGAMSAGTTVGWELPFACAAIGLLLAGAVLAAWRDDLPRRLASALLVAVFAFLAFKQGFVRQGLGNTPDFFAVLAGGAVVIASRLPALGKAPRQLVAAAFAAPFVVLALAALPTVSLWKSLGPEHHVESLRQGVDALVVPGERAQLLAAGLREMRQGYGIDPGILRALGGRTVHVDPAEIGVAWAYDLNWRPLPVMQSYAAYTPDLDELNARALSGGDGPEAILRPASGGASGPEPLVDGRFPGWDSPAASRAMLCHYRSVGVTPGWQLLERAGDRCGPVREIAMARTATGRRIQVPSPPNPGDVVFMSAAGLGVEGPEALRAGLYRARQRWARLGDGRAWKVVGETAADGLLMSAPVGIDYPGRFRLAPDSRTVSFALEGGGRRSLTVRFFAQAVHEFPAPADSEPWLPR